LDLTFRTIEKRIKRYRNLVVLIVLIAVISLLLAIFCHQWLLVGGLIFLVPLIGGFSYLDSMTVRRWREEILQMSRLRNLDIALFLKTVCEFRRTTPPMLQGMLSTISSEPGRNSYFDKQQRIVERLSLGVTILLTLSLACFVGGAYYHSVTLLFCGIASSLLFALFRQRARKLAKTPDDRGAKSGSDCDVETHGDSGGN
jgi:hypothetical protein